MDDGCYIFKNGEVYKVYFPIGMKPTKTVNIKTGEIRYPTNYDRITHMSVEELAEWLTKLEVDTHNYGYACADNVEGEQPYPDDWLEWLREEAE